MSHKKSNMANLYGMSTNPGFQCTTESTFTSPSSNTSNGSRLSMSSRKRSKERSGNKCTKKSKEDSTKITHFARPLVTPAEKKKTAAEEGTQDEKYDEQFDGIGRVPDDVWDDQRIAEIDEMVAKIQADKDAQADKNKEETAQETAQENENKNDSEVECLGEDMFCSACQNYEKNCHQYLYGSMLIHEVISMYEKKDEKGKAMVDFDAIHDHMKFLYNIHLRGSCYGTFEIYDEKHDNELPDCIRKSSLSFIADIIKKVQIYQIMKKKREYGAAARRMKESNKEMWKF